MRDNGTPVISDISKIKLITINELINDRVPKDYTIDQYKRVASCTGASFPRRED